MHIIRSAARGAVVVAGLLAGLLIAPAAHAHPGDSSVEVLTDGLAGTSGSAIGPDGALYVTEATLGQVTRVDLRTGAKTVYASGLPVRVVGLGGAIDVAFRDGVGYVLVTLVSSDVGGSAVDGIYRVDGPSSFTVVADLGAFSVAHPPDTDFFVPSGLQFAMEPVRDGFLVTDGHHNRVLRATTTGEVAEVVAFGNVVPTGIAVAGRSVYLAQAGPVPHDASTGMVVSARIGRSGHIDAGRVRTVASGFSLLTDVELDRCGTVYALSQGDSPGDVEPGSPALPASGELLRADGHGGFQVVAAQLDLPTSMEIVRNAAYVVAGEQVLRVSDISTGHGGNHWLQSC